LVLQITHEESLESWPRLKVAWLRVGDALQEPTVFDLAQRLLD